MPDLISQLEHLADLPLYKVEKPYVVLASAEKDDNSHELHNIRMEIHKDILFTDIRPRMEQYTLENCGFEIAPHDMSSLELSNPQQVATYKTETAQFLERRFNAAYVKCYEARLRRNLPFVERAVDLNDAMLTERKAAGAHVDVTKKSGPDQIMHHLSDDVKSKYLKPGYRFRFVNTWRSLLPVAEDNPIAFCDYRSVDKNDLIPCDRIIPDRVGEIYYLKHNPDQRWYWLEHMTPQEPVLMLMYDSKLGNQARFCAHVSIPNPRAPSDAPPRYSMETRSIIITAE